jgi:hypothetical protein
MPLVIDLAIGDELVRLRVGLGRAMKVMDAWTAAIAMPQGAAVCPGMLTSIRR